MIHTTVSHWERTLITLGGKKIDSDAEEKVGIQFCAGVFGYT